MMDSQHNQPQKMRDKVADDDVHQSKLKQSSEAKGGGGGGQLPQPPPAVSSPPSASSSPAHEFSFTISLHHQHYSSSTTAAASAAKAPQPPPSIAADLSPADEIFCHGQLLPLHHLSHSHCPNDVSPRFSTHSLDSFTLPIRDLLDDPNQSHNQTKTRSCSNIKTQSSDQNSKPSRPKSKSFSLFGLSRWRKGGFDQKELEKEKQQKPKKLKFDVSHVIKRYMRMVRPLLTSLRSGRRSNLQLRRQPYSFSGNLVSPGSAGKMMRGRPGDYSAPASIRTSPTNSGLLVATPTTNSSSSDSTMEELQAAIQAAIAHCKNSIAMDHQDKLVKCSAKG